MNSPPSTATGSTKNIIKDPKTRSWIRVWTHANVRKVYNILNHLWHNDPLFTYLTPPQSILNPTCIKTTTNSLEDRINPQLKLLARTHQDRSEEHQRHMLEWWLYLKTLLPDDPATIARQQRWGQGTLAKVTAWTTAHENQADHETGRAAPLRQRHPNRVHPLSRHQEKPH